MGQIGSRKVRAHCGQASGDVVMRSRLVDTRKPGVHVSLPRFGPSICEHQTRVHAENARASIPSPETHPKSPFDYARCPTLQMNACDDASETEQKERPLEPNSQNKTE